MLGFAQRDRSRIQGRAHTRGARAILVAIIGVYGVLGVLFAVHTPAWQSPDEPAHYAYVRHMAEHGRFPILKPGDYPAAYLEEIKAARFPPEMSIDPIRYEFHQPPLYYLLVMPLYLAAHGALLPLRLLSVVTGAVLLLVIYRAGREFVPGRTWPALGATALVAFLPMHVSMTASVNNDTLAELLLATVLLLVLRYLRRSTAPVAEARDLRLLALAGVVTGLGLLTKTSVYVALPLVPVAVAVRHLWLDRDPPSWWGTLRALACFVIPAVLLGLPWWVRNAVVYGEWDVLGLGRHELVVAGQLRTAEFVAQYGSGVLLRDLVVTTFRSFWGQFGWMGVLLDGRLYQALAVLSGMAATGLALWLGDTFRRRARLPAWQIAGGGMLALAGLLTLASYLWYNTQFVQHQGRYLFPALLPLGLAVSAGWHEALRRARALPMAALSLLCAAVLWLAGGASGWMVAMLAGTAVLFAVRRIVPERWGPWVHAVPYVLLPPLAAACLFLFVVPQLAW